MVGVTAEAWALTDAALAGEWWRLWSGHLVHYDAAHLLTNAVAVVVPLGLVDCLTRRRLLLAIPILAPALSLLLLASARFDEYRGASALAMALWAAAALTLARPTTRRGVEAASPTSADPLPAPHGDRTARSRTVDARDQRTGHAMLALVVAKLVAEAAGSGHVWHGVAALPLAHTAGALCGFLAAIVVAGQSRGDSGAKSNARSPTGVREKATPEMPSGYCAGTYVGSDVALSITDP
jgi:membrane associated rhomboid family serine protease